MVDFYFFFKFYFTVLPNIIPFSYDEIINVGDSVELVCQISKGDKPLQISWSFHGTQDSNDTKIRTKRISEKSSLLTIPSAEAYHNGKYTCTASNIAGIVSASTNLTINGIFFI